MNAKTAVSGDWSLRSVTSVALVGARPGRVSTEWLPRNLAAYGYSGETWLVSRRHPEVRGRTTFNSVANLPGVPDLAVLAVPPAECIRLTRECTASGTQVVVVYANGFAESGSEDGKALERELAAAVERDAVLIGPSSLGIADFAAGVCAFGPPIPADITAGDVSLISQSGALLCSMLGAAAEDRLGIDWCVSVGGGARFSVADALAYALRRPATRIIGLYFEGLQNGAARARLSALLLQAAATGRRVIAVQAGASAAGASVALSHTGSVSGDDRLADAFFRAHGVIRAESLEDLLRTASVLRLDLGRTKPRKPGEGLAIVEPSGGSTAIAADLATSYQIPLARFTEPTVTYLREVGGPSAHVTNPVDLTAAAHSEEAVTRAYRMVQEDRGVGAVLVPWSVSLPDSSAARDYHRQSLARHIRLAETTGVPLIVATATPQRWTDWTSAEHHRLPQNVLIVHGLSAAVRALRWILPDARCDQPSGELPEAVALPASGSGKVLEEARALTLLREAGLPAVRSAVLRRDQLTAGVADSLQGLSMPLAVKLIAAQLAHKSAVGGVELGVCTAAAVPVAADAVIRRALAAGVADAAITGVLVAEMEFGPELMVGLSRNPVYGNYLVIGWGGVVTEAVGGHVVELLGTGAAMAEQVTAMLGRLGQGGPAATRLQQAAPAIARLCAEFSDGALRQCATVEINPLILADSGPVAADAVAILLEGAAA